MATTNSTPTPPPPHPRSSSGREDCWTEDASATLIDAWGRRYLELNRGNLRQKDWQHVADLVNARHTATFRTDVQCKNRVDTIKKKYKTEKAKAQSTGVASSWPFYNRLNHLVGSSDSNSKKTSFAAVAVANVANSSRSQSPPMALPLPLGFRKSSTPLPTADLLPKKRPNPTDDSFFRRNYSAVAAAAAAAANHDEDEEEEDESEDEEDELEVEVEDEEGGGGGEEEDEDGIRKLAKAIRRFGEVYERVEAEKQSQMIELEKQRMQLMKDLEVQRMQMFVNMQLQIKKIKIAKRANGQTS